MEGLNQLYPIHQIGSDGFAWWIGQIESPMHSKDGEENKDQKRSGRYKVRIIGHHPRSCNAVKSSDLPWAITMMPVTTPYSSGAVRSATPQLEPGDWVIGFFLDKEQQQPVIMGSIGQVANSGTPPGEDPNPGEGCKSLTTFVDENKRQLDQEVNEVVEYSVTDAGVPLDGTKSEGITDGVNNLTIAKFADASESNRAGINFTVEVADKCPELQGKFKRLLSEMLRDTQQSNGQLGTYVVNQWTGQITDYVDIGRKYVNKAVLIVKKFIAKVKGFVLEKIKRVVDDIVKAILSPSETGNRLTPVTKWFNNMLSDLGCSMADLGLRLEKFLEDLIFGYLFDIYKAAACQVDKMVSGILNKIQSLMENLLSSILGPLQALLGAIASPLNMIGEAINYVLNLLGIKCTGPDSRCNKVTSVTTKCETDKRENFLDRLLESLQDPWDGAGEDWATYTCEEAYEGVKLKNTEVTFVGGRQKTDGLEDRITYNISDIRVKEGDIAKFEVIRTGKTDIASSVFWRTIEGTAEYVTDFEEGSGTVGFSIGETKKFIEVRTLYSDEIEGSEDFFVSLRPGTPGVVTRSFTNSLARCVINKSNIGSNSDPNIDLDDTPPTPSRNANDPTNFEFGEVFESLANDNDGDTAVSTPDGPTYAVEPNKSSVEEGEFVTYTIKTTNVDSGTVLQYQLFGEGITNSDIVGGQLKGQCVIEDNKSLVVVGIEDDATIEGDERLIFAINGTDASATVLIQSQLTDFGREDLLKELDESVDIDKTNVYTKASKPIAGSPITDPGGGIIQVPIENPGTAYTEPPAVLITGQGYGAVGIALLDNNSQVSEVRVTNPGFGYKLNAPQTEQKRCIIDSFTMLTPGTGYTSVPKVYVNGDSDVAEAVVERGMVVSVRIKNRELTFDDYPRVQIIGGGGYGARWIPSFNCLSTEALVKVGSAKIGTGSYIDCP